MFNVNDIKELIEAVDNSGIGELEIKGENKEKIVIKKESAVTAAGQTVQALQPAPAPQAQAPAALQESAPAPEERKSEPVNDDSSEVITSPMVGTFYRAPSPESDPYVREGDSVREDTVVCIVEAMKLMNEIEAEISGKIEEILVDNGELVEYGQPLFRVKKA